MRWQINSSLMRQEIGTYLIAQTSPDGKLHRSVNESNRCIELFYVREGGRGGDRNVFRSFYVAIQFISHLVIANDFIVEVAYKIENQISFHLFVCAFDECLSILPVVQQAHPAQQRKLFCQKKKKLHMFAGSFGEGGKSLRGTMN